MFTTVKQIERYEKREKIRAEWSIAGGVVGMAVIITVFWVMCEIAFNLSGII
jgi:hypothetical protein